MDSIGSKNNDIFPFYYTGKMMAYQDFPFTTFANGTAIPNGHYRLFGAALAYPKDIVSSQSSDLNTYISPHFLYNSLQTPQIERLPGITIYGSLIGYNSYSTTINSPYDTIYVHLTIHAPNGIKKGDIAHIMLPQELQGFPAPFKFQTKSGIDIGLATFNPHTNEAKFEFYSNIDMRNTQGSIGLFCQLKNPEFISTGRHFYKFTNLGVDQYRYLNFESADQTIPRIGCRNDGMNGWIDIDVPQSYGNWSHINITAWTSSGGLFDGMHVKIVESTALDSFGNITRYNDVNKSLYLVESDQGVISIDLKRPEPGVSQIVRASFPLIRGYNERSTGALAKVQIFNEQKDTTFHLDCQFDSSGMIGNSFTFDE